MRHHSTSNERPPLSDDQEDRMVLQTLLDQDDSWPWTVDELIRDRGDGDRVAVEDAINRLHRGGMIHHTTDDLIYPTRAAIYRSRIGE
jgi:predicted transcriptional regulator